MVSLDMNGRIIMWEDFEDVIDTLRNKSRTHGEINIRIMGFKGYISDKVGINANILKY